MLSGACIGETGMACTDEAKDRVKAITITLITSISQLLIIIVLVLDFFTPGKVAAIRIYPKSALGSTLSGGARPGGGFTSLIYQIVFTLFDTRLSCLRYSRSSIFQLRKSCNAMKVTSFSRPDDSGRRWPGQQPR